MARSLRGLADSLEVAANRAEGLQPAAAPTPAISSDTLDTIDWDLIAQLDTASGHQVGLTGPARSAAAAYPPLPDHCLDLCRRLSGTSTEVQARAQRGWEAGHWAKAAWEGKISKPQPTPKLGLRNFVYIIVKGPQISRVSTAAESAGGLRSMTWMPCST